MDIVYHTKAEARIALLDYIRELEKLQEKYGVQDEYEDSCISSYPVVRYYDDVKGKNVVYSPFR
jgi:hypothetical protein